MKQTCILIPGMHRSGTSAISGVLNILGIYHGSKLMPEASDNSKGFYENQLLYEINKTMLQEMGSNWQDIFFTEEKLKLLNDTSKLEQLLQEEFRYSQYFTIKDPRLAYLFPVYGKALKNLDINLKVILPLRNPLEVAASLKARNGFSEEKSMLLWLHHFLLAERFSRGYPRVFTTFDQLVEDPECVVQMIDDHLGIDLTGIYADKKEQVKEFLTPRMKHHSIPGFNLSSRVPAEIRDIVSIFDKLNSGDYTERFDNYYRNFVNNSSVFYHAEVITSIKGFLEKTNECSAQKLVIENKQVELTEARDQLQQSRVVLDETKQLLDEEYKKTKDLAQKLSISNETISNLNSEFVAHQQSFLEQNQQISSLEANLASYKKIVQEKNKQVARLEVDRQRLGNELVGLYLSRSWRITRWLRILVRKLK